LSFRSNLDEAFRGAEADRKDAVLFLSRIISEENKARIRREMENDAHFAAKQHHFFGSQVRGALRAGGFFYDPIVMDDIWFSWVKEAVYLPKDKIVITYSINERIQRYEDLQNLLRMRRRERENERASKGS
jgi:hypothetical protein